MKQLPYYERDVDFDALAKEDPDFAAISQQGKRKGFIDFQNPSIVQQLTKSLLKKDFGLQMTLPDDRLCPPVPVRWNYVRWIQDLLDTTSEDYSESYDPEREVLGLDVGIGASCIYALLACQTREKWRMAGTDIDEESIEWARKNVGANGLEERVRLKLVEKEGGIVQDVGEGMGEMDFIMTNPPFYESREDFERAAKLDVDDEKNEPSAACTGSQNEMIYADGGEVGFILRIFRESLILRERVQWYTAMLSKLSSLQQILAKIKEEGITNFAVTSLHPGHKTKRWAIGWSFGDLRPRNDVSRHGDLVLSILPPVTAQTIHVKAHEGTRAIGKKLDEIMKGLDVITWEWRPLHDAGVMECKGNVWSRAARRKKQFNKQEDGQDMEEDEEPDVALAVKVTCKDEVEVRWLRGNDFVLFEGFCGMLRRSLNTAS